MAFFGSMGSLTVIEKCEILEAMNYKNIIKSCLGFIALPLFLTADVVVNLGSYDDVDVDENGEEYSVYDPYLTGSGFRVSNSGAPTYDVGTPGRADLGLGGTFGTDFLPLTTSTNLSVPDGYSGAGLKIASTIVDATGNAVYTSTPVGYHRIKDETSTVFQHALGLNPETPVLNQNGDPLLDGSGNPVVIPSERSTDTSFASVFFYEKDDFLLGATNSIVSFTAGNEITASYGLSYASGHGRIIIKNDGNWYVSDAVTNGAQTMDSNSSFYAYDLESDLIIGSASLGSAVLASSFTDIEAVGIHMEQLNFDSTVGTASKTRQFFDGFSADLTPTTVPELISFSTILPFCVVTFLCLRRSVFGLV